MVSRHSRSNVVVVGMVTIVVIAAVILGDSIGAMSSRHIADGSTGPICKTSELTLAASGNVGAGNASYAIDFRNARSQRCVLRGYPTIVASLESKPSVVAPGAAPWPKLEETAERTRNTQAGGVYGSNEQLRHNSLPKVWLLARTGVASVTVDWNEEQPNPETKCWTITKFSISLPGVGAAVPSSHHRD